MAAKAEGASNSAPVKRSLFKKSAWAKPVETREAIDLFSRAKEIFPEVVAENSRNLQKQLESKKIDENAEQADTGVHDGKRRRISAEADDLQGSSNGGEPAANNLQRRRNSGATTPRSARPISKSPKQVRSPASSSEYYRSSPTKAVLGKYGALDIGVIPVISLSDSEDEFIESALVASKSPIFEKEQAKPISIEASILPRLEDEDKEFAQYIARVREGNRRKLFNPLNTGMSGDGGTPELEMGILSSVLSPASGPDPIVSILVSSKIEGTKPCLFKRKLTQRLKDVRVGWCDKQSLDGQPMPDSVKSDIFLTWRMKRVFDVTTCKAMGVKVNAQGMLCNDGDDEGRIHLEAWTEQLFEQHKNQRAAERKRLVRDPLEEEPEVPQAPTVPKLKIILKSKDSELKLQVGPTTPISKLISTFRSTKGVPHDKSITLHLDGDELEPDILVADTDLEDMVTIDVHIN